jgi:hypothetical protein
MLLSRRRIVLATLAGILIACLAAAGLQLLPRLRLGGAIEGVQWVQAAGSMFWAMPITLVALVGAAAAYESAVVLGVRSRMLGAASVGTGAVVGAGAFVAVGTPWYELVDGIAVESMLLGAFAFVAAAAIYLVASARAAG